MNIDHRYAFALRNVLENGYTYEDPNRKGVTRKEVPLIVISNQAEEGFPAITVRRSYFQSAVGELLAFLKGKSDIREFWKLGVNFWDSDFARHQDISEEELSEIKSDFLKTKKSVGNKNYFSLGKIYPTQYAKQYYIFDLFKANPLRTDLVVDMWQVADLPTMALKPCHFAFQIVGSPNGFHLHWVQRSTDLLLGTPMNIQYYYLLGMLLQAWSGHPFLGVIGFLNKAHLYDNQIEAAQRILEVDKGEYADNITATIKFNPKWTELSFKEFIRKIKPHHFKINNYQYVLDEKVEMLTYK